MAGSYITEGLEMESNESKTEADALIRLCCRWASKISPSVVFLRIVTFEQSLALIGLIVAVVLALTGLGIGALAVPDHPDRVKAAKGFFAAAAAIFVIAGCLWNYSAGRSLAVRGVISILWAIL